MQLMPGGKALRHSRGLHPAEAVPWGGEKPLAGMGWQQIWEFNVVDKVLFC